MSRILIFTVGLGIALSLLTAGPMHAEKEKQKGEAKANPEAKAKKKLTKEEKEAAAEWQAILLPRVESAYKHYEYRSRTPVRDPGAKAQPAQRLKEREKIFRDAVNEVLKHDADSK